MRAWQSPVASQRRVKLFIVDARRVDWVVIDFLSLACQFSNIGKGKQRLYRRGRRRNRRYRGLLRPLERRDLTLEAAQHLFELLNLRFQLLEIRGRRLSKRRSRRNSAQKCYAPASLHEFPPTA